MIRELDVETGEWFFARRIDEKSADALEKMNQRIDGAGKREGEGPMKDLPQRSEKCAAKEDFFDALALGSIPKITGWLSAGYTANSVDSRGDAPLAVVARQGHLDAAALLLDRGAVIGAQNARTGNTALMEAAKAGKASMVRFLLERGADVVTDTELDLKAGHILGTVKKMSANSKYEIKLPKAALGLTSLKNGPSFGLGMAITHRIVEDHKGTIDVQSQVGLGTTFIIHLPLTA